MLRNSLHLLLFALMLHGCSWRNSAPGVIAEPASPSDGQELSPLDSTAPATPQTTDFTKSVSEACVTTRSIDDIQLGGVLVLREALLHDSWLWNLQTNQRIVLGEVFPILAVSPDFKELAYTPEDSAAIVIRDADGRELLSHVFHDETRGVVQWVDQDTLMLERFEYKPYTSPAVSVLYNLRSQNSTEYSLGLPGFAAPVPPGLWGNFSYTNMAFNSDLTRVVYRSADAGGYPFLTLWDMQKWESIQEFAHGLDVGGPPTWARNGDWFLTGLYPSAIDSKGIIHDNAHDGLPYKGGFDLFEIGRDGDVRRLTFLTTQQTTGEEAFALSPTEDRVAFWLNSHYRQRDENAITNLSILDLGTGKIIELCIPGGGSPFKPVWSPDGKFLAVTTSEKDGGPSGANTSVIYIVDIDRGIAAKLMEDTEVVGWMTQTRP